MPSAHRHNDDSMRCPGGVHVYSSVTASWPPGVPDVLDPVLVRAWSADDPRSSEAFESIVALLTAKLFLFISPLPMRSQRSTVSLSVQCMNDLCQCQACPSHFGSNLQECGQKYTFTYALVEKLVAPSKEDSICEIPHGCWFAVHY
jgi:hypothetical protein